MFTWIARYKHQTLSAVLTGLGGGGLGGGGLGGGGDGGGGLGGGCSKAAGIRQKEETKVEGEQLKENS